LILSFWSCQCVVGIDTPKEVNPTFYSHVLFINAHPEFDEINFLTDNNVLVKSLYYNTNPKSYTNINPGNRNIQITNYLDSVIFNSTIDLSDNQKYTFIAYGSSKRVQTIFFTDTIKDYSVNNMYFRLVNVSPDSPVLISKVEDQYPIFNNLSFRSTTKYFSAPGGSYDIELKDALSDSLVLASKNIPMSTGKVYTILIKGMYLGEGSKKMQLQVIENDPVK
jgi:hypothetical protein